jgi:hypothetical protein
MVMLYKVSLLESELGVGERYRRPMGGICRYGLRALLYGVYDGNKNLPGSKNPLIQSAALSFVIESLVGSTAASFKNSSSLPDAN